MDLYVAPKSAGFPEVTETHTMLCPRGIVARTAVPHPGHSTFSVFITTFLSNLAYGKRSFKNKVQEKNMSDRYRSNRIDHSVSAL